MHRLQRTIFSLKCYAWGANLRIELMYTYSIFWPNGINFWMTNQCLSQNFGISLYRDFISIARNVDLADILHPEGGVTQNDFENSISLSQIKILFLHLGFRKRIVSNRLKKIH